MNKVTVVFDCDAKGEVIDLHYDLPDDDQAIMLLLSAARFLVAQYGLDMGSEANETGN